MDAEWARRASVWLVGCQSADGGWGESPLSYEDPAAHKGRGPSTAAQTAWAVMGLLATGHVESPTVHRGVFFLLSVLRAVQ